MSCMVTVELWTCQSTLGDVSLMREIEVSNHKHIIIKLLNKEKNINAKYLPKQYVNSCD